MGKMKDAAIKLAKKVTNQEIQGEAKDSLSNVIEFMADNYEGGATYTAGNGVEITEENVINADVKTLEVSNITALTTEQCESLNVGDIVVKLTSNQKHRYMVSYKESGVGMCLTYVDASTSETVSYDFVEGNWIYNSTDVTELGSSGEDKKYLHMIYIHAGSCDYIDVSLNLTISRAEPFTDYEDFNGWLREKGMVVPEEYIQENTPTFTGITCNVLTGNGAMKAVLKGTCIDVEYENKLVFDTLDNYQSQVFVHDYDYTILDNVIEA